MKLPVASLPRCGKVFRTSATEERTGAAGAATLDPSPDGRDAGVRPVEDRVLQPLPRRPQEEPLHGAHPQGRGRREVKRPVGTRLQPLADLGRPVRGRVVEDDVHRGPGTDPLEDMVEKGGEHLQAVPLDRPARDLAGGDVEGRPQSWVRVSSEAAAAFFPAPVSALARPLSVTRRDDGGVGRVDLWTDDVADPDLEPRVPGHLEVFIRCGRRPLPFRMPGMVETAIPILLADARTVGLDIPVRWIVCIRPRPEPSSRTVQARQTCPGVILEFPMIRSSRARSRPKALSQVFSISRPSASLPCQCRPARRR